jgi:hypothetical protein
MTQTGPASDETKAIVSRNALKHGMEAKHVVIDGIEEQHEWEELRDSIFNYWEPVGGHEAFYCERFAVAAWKLRRFERWQTARIEANIHNYAYEEEARATHIREQVNEGKMSEQRLEQALTPDDIAANQLLHLIPVKDINTITRYEAHLHRQALQNAQN